MRCAAFKGTYGVQAERPSVRCRFSEEEESGTRRPDEDYRRRGEEERRRRGPKAIPSPSFSAKKPGDAGRGRHRLQGKQEEERRRHDDRLMCSCSKACSCATVAFANRRKEDDAETKRRQEQARPCSVWIVDVVKCMHISNRSFQSQERIKREEEKRKKEEASEILRSSRARLVSLLLVSGYATAGGGAPTAP